MYVSKTPNKAKGSLIWTFPFCVVKFSKAALQHVASLKMATHLKLQQVKPQALALKWNLISVDGLIFTYNSYLSFVVKNLILKSTIFYIMDIFLFVKVISSLVIESVILFNGVLSNLPPL